MSEIMVQADNLMKIYKTKDIEVVALQGLDLTVEQGELMAIIGNSGSGKSTFLNMIGGLDKPSAGKLFVDGNRVDTVTANQQERQSETYHPDAEEVQQTGNQRVLRTAQRAGGNH